MCKISMTFLILCFILVLQKEDRRRNKELTEEGRNYEVGRENEEESQEVRDED